jgi:HD-GYP domain-containing protein (c-di-GMP phosphodiesterase class II)
LWLSQLKNKDKYTAQHSLNVCVLSIVLGRHIGLKEEHLNHVGLCGMMHDMGKMLVPLEVLNKPGRHDEDELEIMKSHTTLGYELLKSSDGMFYGAVETALTHHERMDGKGYPRKINSSRLSYYSNIVAIADIYDAITSDRVYQKGRTHHEATKIMLDVSGSHLETKLVVKFIESLGAYPPGCFVELNDGSVAVVLEVSGRFKLRPKILMVLDEDKYPVDESVVDLSDMILDATGNALSIRAIINPVDYQIDTEKYYQQGVIQKGFAQRK